MFHFFLCARTRRYCSPAPGFVIKNLTTTKKECKLKMSINTTNETDNTEENGVKEQHSGNTRLPFGL